MTWLHPDDDTYHQADGDPVAVVTLVYTPQWRDGLKRYGYSAHWSGTVVRAGHALSAGRNHATAEAAMRACEALLEGGDGMSITFGSLFSGIGGFDLGFERASMQCDWQCEIDKDASGVLRRHWPNVPNIGDVHDINRNAGAVDLVCGGFPCQGVSIAGKRAGLAGERSGLWFEFHRVLAELRPRWVVVENVPGLLSSNGGRDFAVILCGLVKCGYGVAYRVFDAQYDGVAQQRRRVFVVGSLGNGRAAEILFESESLHWDTPPSREAGQAVAGTISGGARLGGFNGQDAYANQLVSAPLAAHHYRDDLDNNTYALVGYGEYSSALASLRADGGDCGGGSEALFCMAHGQDGAEIVKDGSPSLTSNHEQPIVFEPRYVRNGRGAPSTIVPPLKAQSGQTGKGDGAPVVAYNWQSGGDVRYSFGLPNLQANQVPAVGIRRLTPTECERLQGFPDGWTAGQSDSARYRQLGNAVCVPTAKWIGRRIMETEQ